jgi:ubiquitin-protein ligase
MYTRYGCNFGKENNNPFTWRVAMIGPKDTPYQGG